MFGRLYRYYGFNKKGKYYTEEYEKHACSFIITIHWFFIDISIYLTSFTFTLYSWGYDKACIEIQRVSFLLLSDTCHKEHSDCFAIINLVFRVILSLAL